MSGSTTAACEQCGHIFTPTTSGRKCGTCEDTYFAPNFDELGFTDGEREAFEQGLHCGAQMEQDSIVRWLRARADRTAPVRFGGEIINSQADAIERGEHRQESGNV